MNYFPDFKSAWWIWASQSHVLELLSHAGATMRPLDTPAIVDFLGCTRRKLQKSKHSAILQGIHKHNTTKCRIKSIRHKITAHYLSRFEQKIHAYNRCWIFTSPTPNTVEPVYIEHSRKMKKCSMYAGVQCIQFLNIWRSGEMEGNQG